MGNELLNSQNFDIEIKKLLDNIDNIDNISSSVDIYKIIVDEQLTLTAV